MSETINPHSTLLDGAKTILNGERWVEVTHEVPFGFGDFDNDERVNISIDEFLNNNIPTDNRTACAFHILLGCGVERGKLIQAINLARTFYRRVLVIEHDRSSADWDNESVRREHHIDNCLTVNELLDIASRENWKHRQTLYFQGEKDNKRNIIFEIEGNSVDYFIDSLPKIEQHEASFKNLRDVYLGNADPVNVLPKIYEKINEISTTEDTKIYSSCGGHFSLNILRGFVGRQVSGITFYDVNPYSVKFCESVMEIIKYSATMKEFVENYLLHKINDEDENPKKWKFEPIPQHERIVKFESNYKLGLYNEETIELFKLIMMSAYDSSKLYINGLMHLGGTGRGYLDLFFAGEEYNNNNSMSLGCGWLKSEKTYEGVRNLIMNSELEFTNSGIDDLPIESSDVILSSNILGFINKKPTDFGCTLIEGE